MTLSELWADAHDQALAESYGLLATVDVDAPDTWKYTDHEGGCEIVTDPASHPAHDFPLAERIINDLIGNYIRTAAGTAKAANGYLGDKAAGFDQAVDQMRHLYLAGWDYRLTPRVIDALRRAGLLRDRS